MAKELYFDISTEKNGGSLYRITDENGKTSFLYSHSTYDDTKDEVKIFETPFPDFSAFWKNLLKDPKWFYWHPLYIHPEQRSFVQEQLKKADWTSHPNKKWQESHQRQWKKVLTDPGNYYKGPATIL